MPRPEPLNVWLEGVLVAELTARKPWDIRCRYTQEALERWDIGVPLLSCSLPLGHGRPNASIFASGLLPEGQHRLVMAANIKVANNDTFALLSHYGRDVAGALVIGHEPPEIHPGGVEPYSSATLDAEVAGLPEHPLAIHDDSELSVAGLQDKLLLVRLAEGRWGRPVHGAPSTHILKVDDARHPGLVDAEADCLLLAKEVELTTVDAELADIGGARCLIVSRYDRETAAGGETRRIHQEDACQALARDPEANQGRGKYQAAGGPSLAEIAALLDRWSLDGEAERRKLLGVSTFDVVTGNADAHGKNISILHPAPGAIALAPLYDTVPTVMWSKLRSEAAMLVNNVAHLDRITEDDLVSEAVRWGLTKRSASAVVAETIERLDEAAKALNSDTGVAGLVRSRIASIRNRASRPAPVAAQSLTGRQGRVQRGVPSGGQFSGKINPESNLQLGPDPTGV